jgi:hypothetical protein
MGDTPMETLHMDMFEVLSFLLTRGSNYPTNGISIYFSDRTIQPMEIHVFYLVLSFWALGFADLDRERWLVRTGQRGARETTFGILDCAKI